MGPIAPKAFQRNEPAREALPPCASAVPHVVLSSAEATAGLLPTGVSKVALLVAAVALWGMVHILDCGQQPAPGDYVAVNAAVCGGRIGEMYD